MSKIRKSGGYRQLRSFQLTTIIYDSTYWFCEKFVSRSSRTNDQMVQAARSGRQNIAEGSRASGASSQSELKLTNVARSSLEELLLDYEDFIRQRRGSQWDADSPDAQAVRQILHGPENGDTLGDIQRASLYDAWLLSKDPFIRANALICLIHQANYLLDRQIAKLEKQFIEGGGYTEQLASQRIQHRSNQSDKSHPSPLPPCPDCGQPTAVRTAKKGSRTGSQFLGCTGYPSCKGTLPL
jgi:four helix bundle suffix protein